MGDPARGLYRKFDVVRTDGQSAVGQKHSECEYFVLDLSHDPYARVAVLAYSIACGREYPLLAQDLMAKLSLEPGKYSP